MKKINIIIAFLLAVPGAAMAQSWPQEINYIAPAANDSVTAEGNLSNGKIISDLSWASSSFNACFTAVQFPKFQGNHVFYGTTIPSGSVIKIKVTPANKDEEISLYGYMLSSQKEIFLVPNLPQSVTCEADYKRDRPVRGKVMTNDREIEFRNPTANTYNIVIGVSAPKGVAERKFSLMIKTIL